MFGPNPAPTNICFFSLNSRLYNEYQADILEQFDIFKMATKMAAGATRKITFEPVNLELQVILCFLAKLVMSNPFYGVICAM